MNCLECEEFQSCDFIQTLLDLVPSICVTHHYNTYGGDSEEKEG